MCLLQYVKMRKWPGPAYYAYYWQRLCNGRGEKGALLGEAERGEMTCCQSELTVTAQCFGASRHSLFKHGGAQNASSMPSDPAF